MKLERLVAARCGDQNKTGAKVGTRRS